MKNKRWFLTTFFFVDIYLNMAGNYYISHYTNSYGQSLSDLVSSPDMQSAINYYGNRELGLDLFFIQKTSIDITINEGAQYAWKVSENGQRYNVLANNISNVYEYFSDNYGWGTPNISIMNDNLINV